MLFAIWGAIIFFLNKWGKDASDESDTAKVDRLAQEAREPLRPGHHHLRHHHHRRRDAVGDVAGAGLGLDDVPGDLRGQPVPDVLRVLPGHVPALRKQAAVQGRVCGRSSSSTWARCLLAFTLFWSYTSFSQFMLVWIGNLPGGDPVLPEAVGAAGGCWYCVSAALIVLHFALPFLLLLFRDIKLHPVRLRVVAVYLLVICAVDVIVVDRAERRRTMGVPVLLMDLGAILAIGGVWGLVLVWQLKKRPLLPASQVFMLPEGHHHEHH